MEAEQQRTSLVRSGWTPIELLASYPLDAVASTGGRFADDPPTLEWICFHVLAGHAGQLDIVVELGR